MILDAEGRGESRSPENVGRKDLTSALNLGASEVILEMVTFGWTLVSNLPALLLETIEL